MGVPKYFDEFVPTQEAIDLWRRYSQGERIADLCRDLGLSHPRVHTILDHMRDVEAELSRTVADRQRAA